MTKATVAIVLAVAVAAVAGFVVGGLIVLGLKAWASLRPGRSAAH